MKQKNYPKIPLIERTFIARNISLMLKSGINESESLAFIASQVKTRATKEILLDMQKNVESGIRLSKAMEQFESAFGSLFIHFIRVGESSGTLEETLAYAADQLERDNDIVKRVRAAAVYPGIIIGIVLVYAAVFAYVIFPRLEGLYDDFSGSLPWITEAILTTASWMRGWGIFIIAGIIIACILLQFIAKQSKSVSRFFDSFFLHIPILRTLMKEFQFARLFRMLGFLLKSGAPITETLTSAQDAVDSAVTQDALKNMSRHVEQGKSLSSSMKETKYFSPLAVRLIEVAERSGSLESTLFYLSDFYDRNVDYSTKNLSSVLEPVLLILVGIAVAVLAIAIILPIYQFSGSISAF